jgi:DNA polymerase-3 subunit delta'
MDLTRPLDLDIHATAPTLAELRLEPIHVPKSSDVLADQLRRQILKGTLAPGSPLPTERDLVTQTGLSRGSVREALRLLGDDGVAFDAAVHRLFDRLPQVDWLGTHMLADKLTGRDNEAAYETFMRATQRHLDARVRELAGTGAPPIRLAGYARAWEEIRSAARETEVFNFDKRALVLGVFERLARAEGG